jgi:hypothetical protein
MRSAAEAGRLAHPLRRFQTVTRCPPCVAARQAASHEVDCASECCMWRSSGSSGSPVPAVTSPLPDRLRGCLLHRPPELAPRVHPLVRFASSSESRSHSPPAWSPTRAPPLGSCSPSRHHRRSPLAPEASQAPGTFRPRRFSRPRRLTPPTASRVYFTPQPRPGFTPQGFSPSRSHRDSSPRCALLPVGARDGIGCPLPPRVPAFRAFLRARIRRETLGD